MDAASQIILIVSHDAGGAEILSAWVKENSHNEYYFMLDGPALPIFSRKITDIKNNMIGASADCLDKVNLVITSTSWGSNLEKKVIREALKKNIFVISYLDHWCNYLERFLYQGEYCLPNKIWVGDEEGYNIAKKTFHEMEILLVPNPYFMEIEREINQIKQLIRSSSLLNILYICEPVRDAEICNYSEFSALELFFDQIHAIEHTYKINQIKLRLHPSENENKYDCFLEKKKKQIVSDVMISKNTSLFEDIVWSDWVVGVSSMALVMATIARRKVYSCIPKNGIATKLPVKNIKNFVLDALI